MKKITFEKLKEWRGKWIFFASILGLGTTGGLIPAIKYINIKVKEVKEIVLSYPDVLSRLDSLEIKTLLLEQELNDYDIVKEGIQYLVKDNEVSSGLLSANMKKLDDKNYGTVLTVYDEVEKKYVRRLVEVKLRKSIESGDLFVFVSSFSWGQEFWGIPLTRKYSAKWHEDEQKYFFIDGKGEIHLIYEVDLNSTIRL